MNFALIFTESDPRPDNCLSGMVQINTTVFMLRNFRWHMTHNMWHMTCDIWHLTYDRVKEQPHHSYLTAPLLWGCSITMMAFIFQTRIRDKICAAKFPFYAWNMHEILVKCIPRIKMSISNILKQNHFSSAPSL